MERVSILIEIDGMEKVRIPLNENQVKDFALQRSLTFAIVGVEDFDRHAHCKLDFVSINGLPQT